MPTYLAPSEWQNIWRKVVADRYALPSLKALKQAGFDLQSGTWPARIATIPFLPNRRARTRAVVLPRSSRLVIRFLRELAHAFETPYWQVEAHDPRTQVFHKGPSLEREMHPRRLAETADLLEKILSRRWAVAEHNRQQNEIACLRWEIKSRTGHAQDTALVDLLNATFEAAGYKNGFRMEYATLKKVLRNESNTRMALRRKVRRTQSR